MLHVELHLLLTNPACTALSINRYIYVVCKIVGNLTAVIRRKAIGRDPEYLFWFSYKNSFIHLSILILTFNNAVNRDPNFALSHKTVGHWKIGVLAVTCCVIYLETRS